MAVYKVLQDIEAEDKFLGPLTLKQAIYSFVSLGCLYFFFTLASRGAWQVGLVFFPPMILFGFLGFPWGRDQPTEVWILSRLHFYFKPRKKLWDQSGIEDFVEVRAPKRVEKNYTDGLSQNEVRSRLGALANTLDTRGWAVKNATENLSLTTNQDDERLISVASIPREVPPIEVLASEDILDVVNNQRASAIDAQVQATQSQHKAEVINRMHQADNPQSPNSDYWFMHENDKSAPSNQATFTQNMARNLPEYSPEEGVQEEELLEKLHKKQATAQGSYGRMHSISAKPAPQPTTKPIPKEVAQDLSKKDYLNVSTLAREAKRQQDTLEGGDEVVISLH